MKLSKKTEKQALQDASQKHMRAVSEHLEASGSRNGLAAELERDIGHACSGLSLDDLEAYQRDIERGKQGEPLINPKLPKSRAKLGQCESIRHQVRTLRLFRLKYLPCTNHKPARWKLTDLRFGGCVTISRDSVRSDTNHFSDEAIFWLCWERDICIEWLAEDEVGGGFLLATRNFRNSLKTAKEEI